MFNEPPYAERHVRWCERTVREVIPYFLLDYHLPAHATGATVLCAMTAILTVFAGSAIAGSFAGGVMFFVESVTGKYSTNGSNCHQARNDKHSFHKV